MKPNADNGVVNRVSCIVVGDYMLDYEQIGVLDCHFHQIEVAPYIMVVQHFLNGAPHQVVQCIGKTILNGVGLGDLDVIHVLMEPSVVYHLFPILLDLCK